MAGCYCWWVGIDAVVTDCGLLLLAGCYSWRVATVAGEAQTTIGRRVVTNWLAILHLRSVSEKHLKVDHDSRKCIMLSSGKPQCRY